MELPIVTFPNDILRQPAQPVSFPLSKEHKKLALDMIDTVRKADGIGLAAPQVNQPYRIIVINLEKSEVPAFALFNPRVVSRGPKKIEVEEGCLSIPGVYAMVKRPQKVTIEAENFNGETVQITDEGWVSRVAQHEIDHTNGILILDHTKKFTKGEEIVKEWEKKGLLVH